MKTHIHFENVAEIAKYAADHSPARVTAWHGESKSLFYIVQDGHDGPITSYDNRDLAEAFCAGYNLGRTPAAPSNAKAREAQS
jgi:hypothetical protein